MGGSVGSRPFRARQLGTIDVASEGLLEAAIMFSSHAEFRELFVNYVLKEEWIQSFFTENPNIFLFGETDEMSYLLPDQYNYSIDNDIVTLSFDDELIRRSSRACSLDQTDQIYTSRLTSIFAENDRSMIPLLLAAAYPCFLKSEEFHYWLNSQKNPSVFEQTLLHGRFHHRESHGSSKRFDLFRTPSASIDETDLLHPSTKSLDVHFIAKRTQSKQQMSSVRNGKPDYLRLKTFLHNCLSSTDASKATEEDTRASMHRYLHAMLLVNPAIPSPLTQHSWLPSIKSLLDHLPAAITIASTRPHPVTHETFPLLYVNKAFEHMTQYSQAEILGRNCRFLQSEATIEMNQVDKMRTALQSIIPIKLTLSNVRKDGSRFYNFLALRPVFNQANEYAYVIGIHYEVSAFDFHRFFHEHRALFTQPSSMFSSFYQNSPPLSPLHDASPIKLSVDTNSTSNQNNNNNSSSLDSTLDLHTTFSDLDLPTSSRKRMHLGMLTPSADLGNFARDFQYIEDLLNLIPSVLY